MIPSRHLDAGLLGLTLMGVLMALALDRGQVEALQWIALGFAPYFGAVGGSAYARHNGAREPSGGVTQEAPTRESQEP